jgi:hypothetical protein
MLQVDMGFLPYFDFGGQEYHFGGHAVVACGLDAREGTVLIADRDSTLHTVSLATLAAARASTFKPFPPQRRWWDFDFLGFRKPRPSEVLEAIRNQAGLVVDPAVANLGIAGIRKAASEVGRWDSLLGPDGLRGALFNLWIYVSAVGGTGGGAFRTMLSRFLREAAEITGRIRFEQGADCFQAIAAAWDEVAALGQKAAQSRSHAERVARLPEISRRIGDIADREEPAWGALASAAG